MTPAIKQCAYPNGAEAGEAKRWEAVSAYWVASAPPAGGTRSAVR